MSIAQGKSLTMSGNACALPVGDIKGEDHARVFYYSIFPNMLLSMHPEYVMVHQLWPQSPARTLIQCDWFFHPEAFERSDFRPGRRSRVLGHDEQTGLACLRTKSAGDCVARLPAGAVFAAGKYSGGVGSGIFARMSGKTFVAVDTVASDREISR